MGLNEFRKIESDFEFLEDWEDRYRYIIDLGKNLQPIENAFKTEFTKVEGCASQVWLTFEVVGEGSTKSIVFRGDSDAIIVKGLIAIVLDLFNGLNLTQAKDIDAVAELQKLDLKDHLSTQRSNGLRALIERINSILKSVERKS